MNIKLLYKGSNPVILKEVFEKLQVGIALTLVVDILGVWIESDIEIIRRRAHTLQLLRNWKPSEDL